MKINIFNRLIDKFEKDMTWLAKQKIKEYFGSCKMITFKNKDSDGIKKLISQHNAKVAEYNKKGEEMAILLIHKMDQLRPHPHKGWLGSVDELLKMRRLNRKDAVVFRSVNNHLHYLNQSMQQLYLGSGGIEELRKKINTTRKG